MKSAPFQNLATSSIQHIVAPDNGIFTSGRLPQPPESTSAWICFLPRLEFLFFIHEPPKEYACMVRLN